MTCEYRICTVLPLWHLPTKPDLVLLDVRLGRVWFGRCHEGTCKTDAAWPLDRNRLVAAVCHSLVSKQALSCSLSGFCCCPRPPSRPSETHCGVSFANRNMTVTKRKGAVCPRRVLGKVHLAKVYTGRPKKSRRSFRHYTTTDYI